MGIKVMAMVMAGVEVILLGVMVIVTGKYSNLPTVQNVVGVYFVKCPK